MDLEDEYGIDNEGQFWDELDKTVSQECETHSHIDDVLRSYLTLITDSRGKAVQTEFDLGRCSFKLTSSPLFSQHDDYIRQQFVHSLLQEEETSTLLVTTSFLLEDARTTERTFEMLNEEGGFARLVDLISSPKEDDEEALHRMLMELLYEMSRIQKISLDNLAYVTDEFIQCLFDIIEQVSNNVTDPYHYPVIRVLLVLNEQFMVAAHDPAHSEMALPLTNKVVKVLSAQGNKYKTFGENIILLLNREDETSLQLLTLKLLYLLFTTPPTYEYFYTNDLRVLVDILIRNLLDLPEESAALRHTYLRVLYPLLEHTQLQDPPYYKREAIRKLLTVLGGGQVFEEQEDGTTLRHYDAHFNDIDDTTKRLVRRCQGVSWLADPEVEPAEQTQSPTEDVPSEPASPISPSKQPPALPLPRKLKKRNSSKGSTLTIGQYLTPQLESARQSSLSMMEMAAQKEKPGVITPSRNPSLKHTLRTSVMHKKDRPPPPKARRSGWARMKMERTVTENVVAQTNVEESPVPISPEEEKSYDTELVTGNEARNTPETAATSAPPPPPLATKPPPPVQPKRPPPAPKARRWGRGKRIPEEGQRDSRREPGKFDARLPSINTSTAEAPKEAPPFSPPLEKTLSPTSPEQPMSSVSEALEQAQQQAVSGITQTLERARLAGEEEDEEEEWERDEPDSPTLSKSQTILPSIDEQPSITVQQDITPQPQAILTPPNPAPPRPVPGPEWELERSPFLSDAELEEASDAEEEQK